MYDCASLATLPDHYGCEFHGLTMDNFVSAAFRGGVIDGTQGASPSGFGYRILASPGAPLNVTITRVLNSVSDPVAIETIDGGASRDVFVPWQSLGTRNTVGTGTSRQAQFGYRIVTSRPAIVQQFNPLRSEALTGVSCTSNAAACTSPQECLDAGTGRVCGEFMFSQDGTMMIPKHQLGTAYIVTSTENLAYVASRDAGIIDSEANLQVAIVSTAPNTTVTVRASTPLRAGTNVPAIPAGGTQVFTLGAFDVLQLSTAHVLPPYIECAASPFDNSTNCSLFGTCAQACREFADLSGTVVTSSQPVAVFVGSPCTSKPFNTAACDHIEEQLAPVNTLGRRHVLAASAGVRSTSNTLLAPAPLFYKVTAVCPSTQCPTGTQLTFSTAPLIASVIGPNRCMSGALATNDCVLAGGASMEFSTTSATVLDTNQPVQVMRFYPSQSASGSTAATGDPSMSLVTPVEQWSRDVEFSTPGGLRDTWVQLTWDSAATSVQVDGVTVTPMSLGSSTFVYANVAVAAGQHRVTTSPAGQPVGIELYGFTAYASYATMGPRQFDVIAPNLMP